MPLYTLTQLVIFTALIFSYKAVQNTRVVTHYHFTSWPDHDVPEYATSILTYHYRISRDYKPSKGPMVVHCR